jgi:hypothetical protein
MANVETEFNFIWSSLVIVLSSALVAFGLRDINRAYYRRHRSTTHAQMEAMIIAMQGRNVEWQVLKRKPRGSR